MGVARKIELILEWAENTEVEFDDAFVREIEEKLSRYGNLTPRQEMAIDNIYERFKIEEWAEEEGLL